MLPLAMMVQLFDQLEVKPNLTFLGVGWGRDGDDDDNGDGDTMEQVSPSHPPSY